MKKLTLSFAAAALMMTGVSCSTPNKGSCDGSFRTSPVPILNRTGLSPACTHAQSSQSKVR
jgi:hypothetical protein